MQFKLEAIQARHHTQHATTYNSVKLEQSTCDGGVGEMWSSSTQLRWLSSLVLSCESCWEDGGVESVENLHFSCSEGRPSSNALPISFSFIDFALWGHTDKKKEYHSLFRTHSCMILMNTTLMKGKVMIRGWNMYEKMDGLTYSHLWCGN